MVLALDMVLSLLGLPEDATCLGNILISVRLLLPSRRAGTFKRRLRWYRRRFGRVFESVIHDVVQQLENGKARKNAR